VWLTLLFYDFCGFRSVTVNSVYKLQFFYIYISKSEEIVFVDIRKKHKFNIPDTLVGLKRVQNIKSLHVTFTNGLSVTPHV